MFDKYIYNFLMSMLTTGQQNLHHGHGVCYTLTEKKDMETKEDIKIREILEKENRYSL